MFPLQTQLTSTRHVEKLLNYGKNIGPMGATCGLGDIFYTASLAPDVENDTIT